MVGSPGPSRVPFDTERYARRSREGPCFVCAILAGDRPHHEVYAVMTEQGVLDVDDNSQAALAREIRKRLSER